MTQTSHTLNGLSPTYCLLCQQQISSFAVDKLNCSAIRDLRKIARTQSFYVISYFVKSLMNTCLKDCLKSRFSKVSSIFGRDAFATMRYVTLLNVSEVALDISNDERKVPFKNDEYLASGTSSCP